MTAVGVALLGALGAVLRHGVGHWAARRGGWPKGTLAINVTGSLLAGLVVGAAASRTVTVALVAGFCGGFTTFSTWTVEVVELGERPDWVAATGYGVGTAALCVVAAWLGLWIAG